MNAPYRASVVIPTYQRCAVVEGTLRSLASQTIPVHEFEVVVSIDGSDDGTWELVDRLRVPYSLRSTWQPNRGRAAACNTGIRAAKGEVLVLLDDDMEPVPEFLEAHLQAHPAGDRLGVMGAVPIAVAACAPPVVRYIGTKFNRHLDKLAHPGHQLVLRDFYSGNFSIRRDILLEVGGFDEAFTAYGNEDLDLSLRLSGAAVDLIYSRQAQAYQRYTKDFAGLCRDTYAKGQTAVLLATKHPDSFADLKLSTYGEAHWSWRFLRGELLRLSDWWDGAPDLIMGLADRLVRLWPDRLDTWYGLALDYFYWLGARSTLSPDMPLAACASPLPRSTRTRHWLSP